MIRQAAAGDLETLADLALLLWPGHARKALSEELSALLTREDAAFFLLSEGGAPPGLRSADCGGITWRERIRLPSAIWKESL